MARKQPRKSKKKESVSQIEPESTRRDGDGQATQHVQSRTRTLAIAAERRNYIESKVINENRDVTFHELNNRFGEKSKQTYRNDADRFLRDGIPIIVKGEKFVESQERLKTIDRRTRTGQQHKDSIARLAYSFVVSPNRKVIDENSEQELIQFLAAELANSDEHSKITQDLQRRLDAYWRKPHRLLILDAGSTTAAISRAVATQRTPDPDRRIAELRILTNSKRVLGHLDATDCNHDVVLLGGSLRKDTDAVCGLLAEQCLTSWALTADIAIIGTTNLNIDKIRGSLAFRSDSESEAQIKSRLLSIASIRCIAAESYKLLGEGGVSAWAFATLSNQFVDVIITDHRIFEPRNDTELERFRNRFLNSARESGVFVAAANPKSLFPVGPLAEDN